MKNYLVDFYTELGRLFQMVKMAAADDADAKLQARTLASVANPAFYTVRRLEQSGNTIIRELGPPTP